MIKFSTSNGSYISLPSSSVEDLETAEECIKLLIGHEKKMIREKILELCNILKNGSVENENN